MRKNSFFDYTILTLTILTSLAILFFSNKSTSTSSIQMLTIELLGYLSRPFNRMTEIYNLNEKNHRLRQENALLQLQNAQLMEALAENERLRKLIGFKEKAGLNGIPSKVIGMNRTGGIQSVLLDTGKNHRLKKNMAVINSQGFVGRIIDVTPRFATCQLLIDRNFSSAARILRNRVEGIYQSRGRQEGQLIGIHIRSDVAQGDVIITSGLNSLFPPGLRIGTVEQVSKERGGLFQTVVVNPAVDFETLEEVFIIDFSETEIE